MILMKKSSELRTDLRMILSDTATGSPVIEIGYTQFYIAVPEEVGMATYQQTEVVPRSSKLSPSRWIILGVGVFLSFRNTNANLQANTRKWSEQK